MLNNYSLSIDITPDRDTMFVISMSVTKVTGGRRVSGTVEVIVPELSQDTVLGAVSKIVEVGNAL